MSAVSLVKGRRWVWSTALLICALMVLPGASFVMGASAAPVRGATPIAASSVAASSAGAASAGLLGSAHTPQAPSLPKISNPSLPSIGQLNHVRAPWLRSLLQNGPTKGTPLASYPNLALLEHPAAPVNGAVNPFYVAQPAPMGIADFGLGSNGPYSYNTSHILGQVTFNTPPNVTSPGSQGVIDPGAPHLGYVGSVYEFGIQLNTVATNITLPGTNKGVFWTQNVIDVNDTSIHFVDDIFNLSAGSGFYIPPGTTFASGCNGFNLTQMLYTYGGVYQCVAGTIPITGANYPLTISLYNNLSVNAKNQSALSFGYRIAGAGGLLRTGISDAVTFVNPTPKVAPTDTPNFGINGFQTSPMGLFEDAEMVFGGQIGGSNAVFRSLNGSLNLEYSNLTTGGWKSVPSAYNFGTDTGETSTGVAGYWTPSHVEMINQGPSMLYGLWNGVPHVSVASGDIQFQGTITPDYGFVFVSNVAPNALSTNMSWVPTNDQGAFNTYLPPAVPPGTQYYVQAFAPEAKEYNGTPFSASQTSYSISLTSAPGSLRAPLYMFSNQQAASLAKNVTGASKPPYTFSNLVVNGNMTFNHLNDYGFPTFVIFMAQGVTVPLVVNDTYQGTSSGLGNLYYLDFNLLAPPGLIFPAPQMFGPAPNYTQQISIFDGVSPLVTNETLTGFRTQGGLVFLWQDTGAMVTDTVTSHGTFGIYVGDSVGTMVTQVTAEYGANGVSDVGSKGTQVTDVTVNPGADGIYALSSEGGTYSSLTVENGSVGVYAGGYFGLIPYYAIPGFNSTTVSTVDVYSGSLGLLTAYSNDTTITTLDMPVPGSGAYGMEAFPGTNYTSISSMKVNSGGAGAYLVGTDYTTVTGVTANGSSVGIYAPSFANYTTVTNGVATNGSLAIYGAGANGNGMMQVVASNILANSSLGIFLYAATTASVTNLTAENGSDGMVVLFGMDFTASTVSASQGSLGVYAQDGANLAVSGLTATQSSLGLEVSAWIGASATNVVAVGTGINSRSFGVEALSGEDLTLRNVMASDWAGGAILSGWTNSSLVQGSAANASFVLDAAGSTNFTTVNTVATNQSLGPIADSGSTMGTIQNASASLDSAAVLTYQSSLDTISSVSASSASTGVLVEYSNQVDVSGVAASESVMAPLVQVDTLNPSFTWNLGAVSTEYSSQVFVSGVSATMYPYGLSDVGSNLLNVNDLNASSGVYGVYLSGTSDGIFNGVSAYQDGLGLMISNGYTNVVTGSEFQSDMSYGVAIMSGGGNYVYYNDFVGDNGAGSTYSSVHIQAYSAPGNYFNMGLTGNYWSDWHVYTPQGVLAPYPISNGVWDYYPLGTPLGTTTVTFTESGLPSGASWSVTLNGKSQTTVGTSITFAEAPGTYSFTLTGPAGYAVTPAKGSVVVGPSPVTQSVNFSEVAYAVTFAEKGLPSGTSWWVTMGGMTESTTGSALTFTVPGGSYDYTVGSVTGYAPSVGSGNLTVSANTVVPLTFVPSPLYTVTFTESGLSSGTGWSVTFNGVTRSGNGTTLTFTVAAGTYSYFVGAVSGYTSSVGSGTLVVNGNSTVPVTFTAPSGQALVTTSTFNGDIAIALALAAVGIVLALVALFLYARRRGGGGGRSGGSEPNYSEGGGESTPSGPSSSPPPGA